MALLKDACWAMVHCIQIPIVTAASVVTDEFGGFDNLMSDFSVRVKALGEGIRNVREEKSHKNETD